MKVHRVFCRYGKTIELEECFTDMDDVHRGDIVIIRTSEGRRIGTALTPSEFLEEKESLPEYPRVLRKATLDDIERQKELQNVRETKAKNFCNEQIKELGLNMKLLDVEYLFGGEKILFFYVSPQRVDFRELVRRLARQFRTRIEMRQLGIRDAARLMLDCGHCGRELCCRTFLKNLKPVSVKTARIQKTTIDPNKISGACGRLMCCLLYEDELYVELKKSIPNRGERVRTERGEAEVLGYNIIQQTVTVQYENLERQTLPVSEVERISPVEPDDKEELHLD